MTRWERDLAHAAFYEGRGRVGAHRPHVEAQVEFLSAYDEEYEAPKELHVPRRMKAPDFWPVPACILAALAVRYHREAALVALFTIAVIGASLAIAFAYHGCKKWWPDVRAFMRRLPETGVDCILIVGAAIAWLCAFVAYRAELWALSWRGVLMASIDQPPAPRVRHQEPAQEAFAFELDLANPELWTAVEPF